MVCVWGVWDGDVCECGSGDGCIWCVCMCVGVRCVGGKCACKEELKKLVFQCFTSNISPQQKYQSVKRTESTMHESLTLLETEGKVGRETLSTVLNAEITTR